jgi:hypothetical protein
VTTNATNWRELASRGDKSLKVRLLWSKAADRVKVVVAYEGLHEELEFHVAGAEALAAFNRPFAHAPSGTFGARAVERDPLRNGRVDATRPLHQSNGGTR